MSGAVGDIAEILARHHLIDPEFVVRTALANVWKVRLPTGEYAALKKYHRPDMANEGAGFLVMAAAQGRAVADVLEVGKDYALIEWLDGPSLGDLSREGKDEQASRALVGVAANLHAGRIEVSEQLPSLSTWFEALIRLKIAPDCPQNAGAMIVECKAMARTLLASQTNARPLHGDLHHDNIRLGPRGYAAFDAKGVYGERCFELANAFRNPKGAGALMRNPERIQTLAADWSERFGVNRVRLLKWAAVKCGLSIAWRAKGQLTDDTELDLLATLLAQTRV